MDKDEFQAWKDSPATQWVLRRLKARLEELESAQKDLLFQSPLSRPAEWAALQVSAAHEYGVATTLGFVVGLEFKQLLEEDELEQYERDNPDRV